MDPGRVDKLIAEFFQPDCSVCGRRDWRVLSTTPDGRPARLMLGAAYPTEAPAESVHFSFFAIVCTNCQYVRLMAADPVEPDPTDLELGSDGAAQDSLRDSRL